jgi:hypothetical protein
MMSVVMFVQCLQKDPFAFFCPPLYPSSLKWSHSAPHLRGEGLGFTSSLKNLKKLLLFFCMDNLFLFLSFICISIDLRVFELWIIIQCFAQIIKLGLLGALSLTLCPTDTPRITGFGSEHFPSLPSGYTRCVSHLVLPQSSLQPFLWGSLVPFS